MSKVDEAVSSLLEDDSNIDTHIEDMAYEVIEQNFVGKEIEPEEVSEQEMQIMVAQQYPKLKKSDALEVVKMMRQMMVMEEAAKCPECGKGWNGKYCLSCKHKPEKKEDDMNKKKDTVDEAVSMLLGEAMLPELKGKSKEEILDHASKNLADWASYDGGAYSDGAHEIAGDYARHLGVSRGEAARMILAHFTGRDEDQEGAPYLPSDVPWYDQI